MDSLWHSKILFGKAWAKETNRDSSQKVNFGLVFGLSAVANFVIVVALSAFIGHDSTLLDGLLKGLLIGLGLISTSIAATYLFASRSLKPYLIDAGFYVVFLTIAGIILGIW